MSITWTKDKVKRLREVVGNGATASEAGNELGVSRSAVISKCHREGIRMNPPTRKAARPFEPRPKVLKVRTRPRLVEAFQLPVAPPAPGVSRPPATLLQVAPDGCTWPLEGGLYCNQPKDGHASYCPVHAAASLRRNSREKPYEGFRGDGKTYRFGARKDRFRK